MILHITNYVAGDGGCAGDIISLCLWEYLFLHLDIILACNRTTTKKHFFIFFFFVAMIENWANLNGSPKWRAGVWLATTKRKTIKLFGKFSVLFIWITNLKFFSGKNVHQVFESNLHFYVVEAHDTTSFQHGQRSAKLYRLSCNWISFAYEYLIRFCKTAKKLFMAQKNHSSECYLSKKKMNK